MWPKILIRKSFSLVKIKNWPKVFLTQTRYILLVKDKKSKLNFSTILDGTAANPLNLSLCISTDSTSIWSKIRIFKKCRKKQNLRDYKYYPTSRWECGSSANWGSWTLGNLPYPAKLYLVFSFWSNFGNTSTL